MNKLQKIKNSIKKFVTSPRFNSLAVMLLVGTVACLAQNTAGNYEAGTTALTTHRCQALLRHCRRRGRRRCDQRLYRHEQRGAGRQEEDHDGGRSLHLPDCSSSGTASVLRNLLTLWQRTQTTAILHTRFSRGFRSLLNSWVSRAATSTGLPEQRAVR